MNVRGGFIKKYIYVPLSYQFVSLQKISISSSKIGQNFTELSKKQKTKKEQNRWVQHNRPFYSCVLSCQVFDLE